MKKILLTLLPILVITLGHAPQCPATDTFAEANIPAVYAEILTANHDLAAQGGARIVPNGPNQLVIVGVGKATIYDTDSTSLIRAQKEAGLDAQLAVLALVDGIKISSQKESQTIESSENNNRESRSRYAQITEFLIEGKIMQLPVIGSWSTDNHLFSAVGGILDRKTGQMTFQNQIINNTKAATLQIKNLDAESPFAELISLYRGLSEQPEGIHFFELEGQQILLVIGTAALNSNPAKAERLARIRAQKTLLGHKTGVKLTRLTKSLDYEELNKKRGRSEQYLHLPDFFRTSREEVKGRIRSLPVVATWNNYEDTIIYVGLGVVRRVK